MASIVQRIRDYLQSTKGRENTEKVKTAARDPQNRQRLRRLMEQVRGHRAHR
ncbi:hypothetical protein GCM10010116_37850 [Microbispora rosea subsp. aerata]|nr:hypothetical protein [Microbispora rosea]GGO18809.1 hypothetical protein GCM10010116_37850 [Microbispora rosea subsp. aerata]GIH54317.1 hypothetical protein Mro02_12310 [Microbispora rosea subsp. aerata]GLJ81287.1 hypothetical protein GCM10017588_00100 [Microbispora rosea subsp. aerata]